jgi:glycosyltransferase involved in cell wall biosynthesis
MMKISILHYAAPPIVGGVESTILHHSRLLTQAGYQIDVIAGRGDSFEENIPFHLIPEIDSRHPEVLKIGKELAAGTVPNEFGTLRDYLDQKISSLLENTDVLIVHNVLSLHKNLPLTASLKLIVEEEKSPLIAWCHDFAWQDELYTPELHPGYPWDLLRSVWQGVRYVAVSDHRRQMLANLLGIQSTEIVVIPPGVDVAQFLDISPQTQTIIDKLHLFESEPIVLLPARLTRRKNIEFAIQVIGELIHQHPRVSLIITGPPGPHNPKNIAYLNTLRSLRHELQLEMNVHFLYELSDNEGVYKISDEIVAELYRVADILLFPSQREGFGIPILEAGLTRTPIFSSDIPPVRESSIDYANLFDPNGDPKLVAGDIHRFLESDQAYLLRRRILSNFTWQSILNDKIIPLINKVGFQNES